MSAVRTALALGDLAAISVRDADNDLQAVSIGRVRDAAAALKTFFDAFSASAEPASRHAFGNSTGAIDVTVSSFTATPSGGVAPYSYAWSLSTPGVNTWSITAPGSQTTGFTCEALGQFDADQAGFVCDVTDASGAVVTTGEVTARATNLGGGL